MAVTQYFLGGNTVRGFVSFYSGFCRGPEDFLWVIKGGPGCGKSSFMKTIGRAAEEKGLDVEYVLCSGDPESVDGVYFPALHTGYADGTAPHVLEAVTPGAAGLYLDLSRFYDRLALQPERRTIEQLQRRYQSLYREAYAKLAALAPAACRLPDADGAQRRFLRAVTCRGLFQSAPPAGAVQLVSAAELEALRAPRRRLVPESAFPGCDRGRLAAGRGAVLPRPGYAAAGAFGRFFPARAGQGAA